MFKYFAPLLFALVCGATLLIAQTGLPAMTALEAAPRIAAGEMLLVDVRTPDEWTATGLAAGAVPIDMRDPQFLAKLAALRKGQEDKPVALICAAGIRSARVQASLSQQNGLKTVNILGGMSGLGSQKGWISVGLPIEVAAK